MEYSREHMDTDRQTDRQMDRQTDRQTDRWINRQSDRQTDRQSNRYIKHMRDSLYIIPGSPNYSFKQLSTSQHFHHDVQVRPALIQSLHSDYIWMIHQL